MKDNGSVANRYYLIFALLLTITIFSQLAHAAAPLLLQQHQTADTSEGENTLTEGDIHTILAGLSDEQVRSLLLQELQSKNTAIPEAVMPDTIPGPAAFFGNILNSLTKKSDSSEEQVQNLLSSIPDVLPDLYKVFLTL